VDDSAFLAALQLGDSLFPSGAFAQSNGLETLVVLPLIVAFGAIWGATGAAVAMLAGTCAFAVMWVVIFMRIRPEDVGQPTPLAEALADEGIEAGALAR